MAIDNILSLRAGPAARAALAADGLQPGRVGALAGAAGGPKWLILSALDRYLFGEWLPRAAQPVDLVGSSIGAWRFAAACHREDPVSAIAALEHAYLQQRYSDSADRDEITAVLRGVREQFLTEEVCDGVLSHPRYRLHAVTVRSRLLTRSERRGALAAGSGLAALTNVVSRRALGWFFERVVFSRPDSDVRWAGNGHAGRTVELNAANIRDAVDASGNIPLLMHGVSDPAGAPPGIYRDGGIVDYHLDQPLVDHRSPAPLVLMPHFDTRIVPGWFDKSLAWRRPRFADNTLMIGPGPGLLDRLVDRRVPDRKDFHRYAGDDGARQAAWQRAIDAGQFMRDAFIELAESDDPARHVEPL